MVRVGLEDSWGTGNLGDAWRGSGREGLPQEVKSERRERVEGKPVQGSLRCSAKFDHGPLLKIHDYQLQKTLWVEFFH